MGSLSELRLAVLVNHPPHTTFWPEIKQAFVDSFAVVAPHARVDFFDPIVRREYPDPNDYDLIILSGGKGDSLAPEPWILRQMEFVRDTVENFPQTKILGICFGHQVIAQALGGKARNIPAGPIAGLVKVDLTKEGCGFFPLLANKGSYVRVEGVPFPFLCRRYTDMPAHQKASQFHVREVEMAPPGFVQLAENNEALVSRSNTILSLQAHPEIDGVFARKVLDDDDTTYTERLTPVQVRDLKAHCADAQDGLEMLRRVIEWLNEK